MSRDGAPKEGDIVRHPDMAVPMVIARLWMAVNPKHQVMATCAWVDEHNMRQAVDLPLLELSPTRRLAVVPRSD